MMICEHENLESVCPLCMNRPRVCDLEADRDAWKARAERAEAELEKRVPLTHDELAVACRNIGFDITCGSCASVFYTGFGGHEHSEGRTTPGDSEPTKIVVGTTCPLCEGIGILEPSPPLDPPSDDGGWNDTARARSIELGRIEAAESRATQAEAQAAAMRGSLECRVGVYKLGRGYHCSICDARMASDNYSADHAETCPLGQNAGRTLLAELAALREVAEVARYACCDRDGDPTQQMLDAFAMLDAARKGEP